MNYSIPKILIIIFIQILIALIHAFRLGQVFSGELYLLYYGYASDLLLPFGAYFLLSINEPSIPLLRNWYIKAGIIFLVTSTAEICQYFGIEALGVTFDPIDFLAYGVGVLLAVFIDVKVLAPNLSFWITEKNK